MKLTDSVSINKRFSRSANIEGTRASAQSMDMYQRARDGRSAPGHADSLILQLVGLSQSPDLMVVEVFACRLLGCIVLGGCGGPPSRDRDPRVRRSGCRE